MLLPGREESEGQACITHIYTAASLLLSTDFYTGRNIKQPQPPQVWLSSQQGNTKKLCSKYEDIF